MCLPDADLLGLDAVALSPTAITLVVSSIQSAPLCPACGQPASRIHSRYRRFPADLPCGGVPLRLELHSRRFYCDQAACPRHIFTERFPGVVPPYSRRTARLEEALGAVAHALGGEAGARLASRLGMVTSPDTLLRRLAATVPTAPTTPRVLGVDDWALRKGQQYATILVDLERRCVVDLLPDRRAETLAEWLQQHPGVEIIARDRGGAYADGAREGAPDAVQVADRWHLLKNLAEALEATLAQEQRGLQGAATAPPPLPAEPPAAPVSSEMAPLPAATPAPATRAERDRARRRERRQALFDEVRRLYAEGYSVRAIAQKLGKSRHTIRKYVQADMFPEPKKRRVAAGQLEPHRLYLEERWQQGCHNATKLWREIQNQGFAGACSAVRRLLSEWRAKLPPEERRTTGTTPRGRADARAPAPRAVVWWMLGTPEKLTEEQAAFLERLKQQCPHIELAQSLALEFFAMARRRDPHGLEGWIARTAASGIEALKNFGVGLRRDWEAVVAGLTLEWSSGPVEGQINRLKLVKRQMFGRAGLALLRARVLPPVEVVEGGSHLW
jgi:transposase